jgi:hypothetical protein
LRKGCVILNFNFFSLLFVLFCFAF